MREMKRDMHLYVLESLGRLVDQGINHLFGENLKIQKAELSTVDSFLSHIVQEVANTLYSFKFIEFWQNSLSFFPQLKQLEATINSITENKSKEKSIQITQKPNSILEKRNKEQDKSNTIDIVKTSERSSRMSNPGKKVIDQTSQSSARKSIVQSQICGSNPCLASTAFASSQEDTQFTSSIVAGLSRGDLMMNMIRSSQPAITIIKQDKEKNKKKQHKKCLNKEIIDMKNQKSRLEEEAKSKNIFQTNRRVFSSKGFAKLVKKDFVKEEIIKKTLKISSIDNRSIHNPLSEYLYNPSHSSDLGDDNIEGIDSPQKKQQSPEIPNFNCLQKLSNAKQQTKRLSSEGKENYSSIKKSKVIENELPFANTMLTDVPPELFKSNTNLLNMPFSPLPRNSSKKSAGKDSKQKAEVSKTSILPSNLYESRMERHMNYWDNGIVAFATPMKEEQEPRFHSNSKYGLFFLDKTKSNQ